MANTKKYVSLDKLGLYDEKIKGVISAGDAAALQSAKDYADSLAPNYDAVGSAATAKTEAISEAKSYTNGQIATVNETVAGVKTIAEQGVADAAVADGKAVAAKSAADAAQAAADAAQGEVDALETYVGVIPEGATATDIVGYVQEKTAGIATEGAMTELGNRVTQAEKDIDAIEADYLKVADKTELQGNIDAVVEDVAEIVEDYLTSADKTELQGKIDAKVAQTAYDTKVAEIKDTTDSLQTQINTIMNNPDAEGAINSINEFTQYVADHGTIADGMRADINKNKEDIAAMDTAYKAADTEIKGRLDVLEAIDHEAYVAADTSLKNELNGEIAKKADKTYVDEQVEALQGVDSGFETRIAGLEAKFGDGEGNVESQIATAKQEAIDAAASAADAKDEVVLAAAKKYADDEDAKIEERVSALEGASATHALKSEVEAVAGRMTTAEGEIDTLQSEMDAVEALAAANKAAHEANAAAIALKASQDDLEAVSGRVTTLETWHSNFVECSQEDINGLFTA